MKSKCQRILSNMRIKNQIILLQLFVLILSLSLLVTLVLINNYLVTQSISGLSLFILKHLQTSSLDSQSYYLERNLQQYMLYQELWLDNLNSLFNYIYNQRETFSASDNLLRLGNQEDDVNYIPYFNQKSCETENIENLPTQDIKLSFELFIKQMNTMFLSFKYSDSKNLPLQYLSTIYDDQYFAVIPPYYIFDTYKPHQRPWYENHEKSTQLNPYREFAWSKPFINAALNELQVTLTRSLIVEQSNKVEGILGIDTKIFSQAIISKFAHIFSSILSQEGQVYSTNCNFKGSNFQFYIYDVETTGFNQLDWKEIVNHYQFTNGTSNCGDTDGFYRYNLLYQECFSIKLKLVHDSFYILNFISMNYINSNVQITNNIENYFHSNLRENIFIFILTGISLFLFSYLLIILFLYPFKQLLKVLTAQIGGEMLFVKKLKNKNKHETVLQSLGLTNFCKNIFQQPNKKSRQCQIVESFKYPRNNQLNFTFNLKSTKIADNICIRNQQGLSLQENNLVEQDLKKFKNLIIKLQNAKFIQQ